MLLHLKHIGCTRNVGKSAAALHVAAAACTPGGRQCNAGHLDRGARVANQYGEGCGRCTAKATCETGIACGQWPEPVEQGGVA